VEQHGSALAPGFRLDRYELLCPIAQGGMAEVWTARQRGKHGFERLVAVKTILPKFADDERFQRMFLDEAHVSSRIEHPNVAQILDVGEQEDITYLVMEYVDGDALSTLHRAAQSRGASIPHGMLLRLMVEVCGGLHAAHELRMADGQHAGVVHRDVSPHNILVNTKGAAKLIDFGLAKARDRIADETSAGTVKGKLRYMAPEQVLGPTIDRRADVWAVGATLYHLLSGEPPYEAETDVEVVRALMSRRPPRPLGRGVHPAVEAVVMRSLAWRPEERFANAHDFQRALEQAIRTSGLEASAAHVASFLAQHMGDRSRQRQDAIALAMREAAERDEAAGGARVSGSLPLVTAPPRPHTGSWPRASLPVPAAPSSGAPSAVSKRLSLVPEPAPRGRSVAWASAVVVAVVVLAGLALAFRARSPATAAGPPVAAAHAQATHAEPRALGTAGTASSAISMTVKVTDLPAVPVQVTDLPVVPARTAVPVRRPPRPLAPSAPDPGTEAPANESDEETTQDP